MTSQPPFDPPLFGVTILGAGHGFDPSHRTSGFVLWINKRGIMVDPPLNSRGILQRSGVPSRLVDSVIITHCHADHDQGKKSAGKIVTNSHFFYSTNFSTP